MTRAGKRKAIRLELFILGTLARGMTVQGVGSGALFGLSDISFFFRFWLGI
jgi:hypothetical protein